MDAARLGTLGGKGSGARLVERQPGRCHPSDQVGDYGVGHRWTLVDSTAQPVPNCRHARANQEEDKVDLAKT
jgi:hypothetical protein